MIAAIVEWARELSPTLVGALGAAAAFLVVLATAVQLTARRLQRELHGAQEELVDERTGLLPRSAIRVRLGAELAWAAASRTALAVAVLRIRGSRFAHAAHALRHAMREEESAFLLGDQHVAVELWGADAGAAKAATARLGEELARAGHPVVDAGIVSAPRDGSDVDTLLTLARRDLRPIEDPRPDAAPRTAQPPGRLGYAVLALGIALVPFVALAALLLLAWRLVPAAVEPVLGDAGRSSSELVVTLVTLLGLPLGAALLHATCWTVGARQLPRSRPPRQWGWQPALAISLVVALPLAWAVLVPGAPAAFTQAFGATLAVLVLVVLALLHARQLVHVPIAALAGLAVAGAAVTWISVESLELPVVANGGRLLLAAGLGAGLARLVERSSWMVFLALLAAFVDVWSVFADAGVTNQLLDAADDSGSRIVDLLLFTGPAIGDVPPFAVGVTDLVFLAMFLSWSHDWRLDMRIVAAAMLAATWAGAVTAEVTAAAVPMLPFLAAAMVLLLAVRSLRLRGRVAAWLQEVAG